MVSQAQAREELGPGCCRLFALLSLHLHQVATHWLTPSSLGPSSRIWNTRGLRQRPAQHPANTGLRVGTGLGPRGIRAKSFGDQGLVCNLPLHRALLCKIKHLKIILMFFIEGKKRKAFKTSPMMRSWELLSLGLEFFFH